VPVLPAFLHAVTITYVNQLSLDYFGVNIPHWCTCILRIALTWAQVLQHCQQSHTTRQPSRRMTEAQVGFTSLLSHTQWLKHANCVTTSVSQSVIRLINIPGIVASIKGEGLAHLELFSLRTAAELTLILCSPLCKVLACLWRQFHCNATSA